MSKNLITSPISMVKYKGYGADKKMIEIKNLTKYYGQLKAIDDLTLTIKSGDIRPYRPQRSR